MSRMAMVGLALVLASSSVNANPFKKFVDGVKEAAQGGQKAALTGNWMGYATRSAQPYPVFVGVQPNMPGQWSFAQDGCSGTLADAGKSGNAFLFKPALSQGSCLVGQTIKLTPANGQVQWEMLDARGRVQLSAMLSPADAQQVAQLQQSQTRTDARARRTGTAAAAAAPAAGSTAQVASAIQQSLEQTHLMVEQNRQAHALAAEQANQSDNFITRARRANAQEKAAESAAAAGEEAEPAPRELMPVGDIQFLGRTLKGANMRSEPTTQGAVVTVIPADTAIGVSAQMGDWYMVETIVDDGYRVGYVFHTLVETDMSPLLMPEFGVPTAGQTNVAYSGYSQRFQEIRQLLIDGELSQVDTRYTEEEAALMEKSKKQDEDTLIKKVGLLGWLERGTLALDQGLYDDAVTQFTVTEEMVEKNENRGGFRKFIGGAATKVIETVSGNEELQPYSADGWEKVLMLNYKTIAYLLQGERRAYNVTRRAIDWQNIEKKKFDQRVADEKAKLEKNNAKEKKKQDKKAAKAAKEAGEEQTPEDDAPPADEALAEVMQRMLEPMDGKAESVASAYVNPFGFYVAGMIQEFESYDDSSMRDNARISYSKALELNPDSEVLKKAAKDMESLSPRRDANLIHVVVANGFVPEKKVLTYYVQNETGGVVPMKLPLYQPVETKVARVEVHSASGKKLGTLHTVADVEALCLRQQKDMQRIQVLRAFGSFLVSGYLSGTAQASTGLIGDVVGAVSDARDEGAAPDTRSWMSLPATVKAARLHVPKGTSRLKIVTFDDKGRRLKSETVDVDPDAHGVVYARTTDNHIYPQVSERLWMYRT